jgi:hypothetical protein
MHLSQTCLGPLIEHQLSVATSGTKTAYQLGIWTHCLNFPLFGETGDTRENPKIHHLLARRDISFTPKRVFLCSLSSRLEWGAVYATAHQPLAAYQPHARFATAFLIRILAARFLIRISATDIPYLRMSRHFEPPATPDEEGFNYYAHDNNPRLPLHTQNIDINTSSSRHQSSQHSSEREGHPSTMRGDHRGPLCRQFPKMGL